MRVDHLAVDGSVVSVEADAELSHRATATGWAIVPSLMRSHPFTISPRGHFQVVERHVRDVFSDLEIASQEDYEVKNGRLKVAEIVLPTATNQKRFLTVGGWEGRTGCLSTSLVGHESERLVEVFDTLQFSEQDLGISIDSPVVAQPRVPEVLKEIPEFGILSIRPAVASELQRIPKSRGLNAGNFEVFRVSDDARDLVLVSNTTIVSVATFDETKTDALLTVTDNLRIEWKLRGNDS